VAHSQRLLVDEAEAKLLSGLGLAYAKRDPHAALSALDYADVRGRGGANFPVARKWASALEVAGPRVLVANAGEHEPGSAKDVTLLSRRAELVLEGLAVAAVVLEAGKTMVAVNGEHRKLIDQLRQSISDYDAFWADIPVPEVVAIPDDYLAGEETALVEVLEQKAARPRFRPPLPSLRGWMGYPTVIQNVETLANCAWLLQQIEANAVAPKVDSFLWTVWNTDGLRVVGESLSGTPLELVLAGITDVRRIKAVTIGGYSGGAVGRQELWLPLSPAELTRHGGLSLGCASLRLIDDDECVGAVVSEVVRFFAAASCGQCFICKQGLTDASKILEGAQGAGVAEALAVLSEIKGRGVCKLPDGAAATVKALCGRFPEEVANHSAGKCGCDDVSPAATAKVDTRLRNRPAVSKIR
jgi:NADH:ubiquinone oxidoreductase subunit F (NADH-binding)